VHEEDEDFLSHYEIKSWEMSPRLYKILAISAVLKIAVVLVAAQGSLLTRKGCDSPLVGSVCQVLDTVVVGSILFGKQREYVDAVYDRTELDPVADITFVDVSKETPPLTYPAGYFAVANPEQFEVVDGGFGDVDDLGGGFTTGNIPGIPPGIPISPGNGGNSIFDTPQHLPKPNPNPIEGTLPGMGGSSGSYSPPIAKRRRGVGGRVFPPAAHPSASPSPSPDDTVAGNNPPGKDPEGGKKVDPTEPVTDAEINKRPVVELADMVLGLQEKNQLKLDSQFVVSATGKLKDGKFAPRSFKYVKLETQDPNMDAVIRRAIEAMNESGYLQYLNQLSGKDLTIQILQDENDFKAVVQSQMDNDLRAKTVASIIKLVIESKIKAKQEPTADQNDKDDLVLLQGAAVSTQGKMLMIGFNVPKADLLRMVQRKLDEQRDQPKPEATVPAKPAAPAS
jgi:hypothetical protein